MYLIPFFAAIIANLLCFILGLDYFKSNLLVFGSYLVMVIPFVDKKLVVSHWKPLLGFFAFSTVTTTILELIFIHTDTWGFSSQINQMIGVNIFHIPIEEYIFWEGCPLVVIFTYMFYKKPPTSFPGFSSLSKAVDVELAILKSAEPSGKAISEGEMYVDEIIKDDINGKPSYFRGLKLPIYTFFVTFVIFSIYEMRGYAKGNYKAIALTALSFFFVIMPYEQYALIHHVWIYNMQKMSGIAFIGVPLEEWIVYFTCPTAGCLFMEMFAKKLRNSLT